MREKICAWSPSWLGSIRDNKEPSALTIPLVTVLANPNGLPMAITSSPTLKCFVVPIGILGKFFLSIFNTARSVKESVPIIFALLMDPSVSLTLMLVAS